MINSNYQKQDMTMDSDDSDAIDKEWSEIQDLISSISGHLKRITGKDVFKKKNKILSLYIDGDKIIERFRYVDSFGKEQDKSYNVENLNFSKKPVFETNIYLTKAVLFFRALTKYIQNGQS